MSPEERDWVLILLVVATIWLGLRYQRLLREQPVPVPDPISELNAAPAPPEPTESSPF